MSLAASDVLAFFKIHNYKISIPARSKQKSPNPPHVEYLLPNHNNKSEYRWEWAFKICCRHQTLWYQCVRDTKHHHSLWMFVSKYIWWPLLFISFTYWWWTISEGKQKSFFLSNHHINMCVCYNDEQNNAVLCALVWVICFIYCSFCKLYANYIYEMYTECLKYIAHI